ncbi:restriction endonuclease subunit S [Hydrogenoanaerobacterium saccharovorans]|uniref:Restriction endonuclease subunit S n=1 Tax=Hydrogenoanaerobacterium saccharovorans TaxID=474960 RepID=A0ABS2GS03_9FIRM|nr:restriction endonuclease subunit S [Hydrogenoanaerobacterium saccharovorans]MBM6924290.1 restriction endonuclease subunit S [Hydrogenoanaerobacterium saccharovorans]
MTPQELKNSILQLAIQGKLVEQRPEEGTAEELFARIQQEKQRLIAEKKIKKEKPLPEITEDEKPFDIPESWKWVRVREIICLNPKNDLSDELEVSFIPMALIDDGYRNNHSFEIKKWRDIKKGFTHFADGDIGIAKITPCFQNRKSVIFRDLKNGYGAGTTELSIVRVINDLLSRDFLLWFFKSAYFIETGVKSFTGTAGQQRIHKDYLSMCALPLPPLAEQKRIVAKIEELLPYLDRYEQTWSKLEQFNTRFPEDMKKSLLQYAIQGKLVEQRPEEGTAEELFAQIQEEKRRLIAEKKIKKEKNLPEITEDEKPFEIPESWKWVRLQQIGELSRGRSQKRPRNDPSLFVNGTVPFIQTGDVARANGHILCWSAMYNQEGVEQSRLWPSGTVCLTIAANIGDVAILDFDGCFPDSVVGFNAYKPIVSNEFFMYGLMCYKTILGKLSRSTAQKNINIEILSQIAFPLPPLSEQKRIVEKLEQLLPLCERLK